MHVLSYFLMGLVTKAYAQVDPCPLDSSILPCGGGGTSSALLGMFINGAKVAFGSILFAMLIYYGVKLIMGADNDSTISESYNSYAYAAIGTILAGGAFAFADTFAVQGILINDAPTNSVIIGVIVAQAMSRRK